MLIRTPNAIANRRGFTLVEMMLSVFILMAVLAGSLGLFLSYRNGWVVASLANNTSSAASFAIERMVYGMGTNSGLRAAQKDTVVLSTPAGGWRIDYNTNRFLVYNPTAQTVVDENGETLCENAMDSSAALTNGGCSILVTVRDTGGGRVSTNTMMSFVQFRN